MSNRFFSTLDQWERRFRKSWGKDLSTPASRKRTMFHYYIFDHALIRTFWSNFGKVADDVYRSNHPTERRLEKMKKLGVKSVLNLRGESTLAPYLIEKESLEKLGIALVNAKVYARKAPTRDEMLHLIKCFRTIEKPFLMHCKSGADRAGLAAALYLMIIEGAPLREARKQLSPRYIHFRFTKTGIVDHILDMYEAETRENPMDIETWIATCYDKGRVRESFATRKRWYGYA